MLSDNIHILKEFKKIKHLKMIALSNYHSKLFIFDFN